MDEGELAHLKDQISDLFATKLVDAVRPRSPVRQAKRPELAMTSANSFRTAIRPYPACWRCLLKAILSPGALMKTRKE